MDEFTIYFNKKRQWLLITLYDVHPNTFSSWKMGRWGCFNAKWESPNFGFFGEVSLVKSRVREDLVAHELLHVWLEWIYANRTAVTSRNEETLVALYDELIRNFYKEYNKLKGR